MLESWLAQFLVEIREIRIHKLILNLGILRWDDFNKMIRVLVFKQTLYFDLELLFDL